MVEFSPIPIIRVKLRTEKEMRSSFLKRVLVNRCAQRSSWTSVCVSMHKSWARNLSVGFFFKSINQEIRVKCVLNWNILCQCGGR